MVDAVRAHHGAAELLDEVAVLVGRLGGGERPEMPAVAREPGRGGVEGLVPGDRLPAAVPPDHRADDAVLRVEEARPEPALHAEHALARAVRRHVVGHHGEPPVVPHRVDDAAAHAAVGAGGLDAPLDPGRRLLRAKGAGGAGGDALAAGRADRRRHEAVAEDADPLGVPPAHEADRPDPLDVVARRRAAPAEDAGLAVEDEERLRVVDGVPVEGRPGRRREPVARRRLAELAEAVAAVARDEHRAREIEDAPPEPRHAGRVRAHRHPVARRADGRRRGSRAGPRPPPGTCGRRRAAPGRGPCRAGGGRSRGGSRRRAPWRPRAPPPAERRRSAEAAWSLGYLARPRRAASPPEVP